MGMEVERQGREADHSPPPSTEVKNGGAIPPSPIRLHGVVPNELAQRRIGRWMRTGSSTFLPPSSRLRHGAPRDKVLKLWLCLTN
jgi:hypothetical protein